MDSSELQARAAQLPKPSAKQVLRLVRFLASRLGSVKAAGLDLQDTTSTGFGMIAGVLESIEEADLLELGKILLMDDSLDLKDEDLDLGWLSEAAAVWAEQVDLPRVVKNVQRVVAAFRMQSTP